MGRSYRPKPWVPLPRDYYLDPAILEAGKDAEIIFVRAWSSLAGSDSDGWLTERQVQRVAGDVRGWRRHVAALVRTKLWRHDAETQRYYITYWHIWNLAQESISAGRAADRGRKRAERKRRDVDVSGESPNVTSLAGARAGFSSVHEVDGRKKNLSDGRAAPQAPDAAAPPSPPAPQPDPPPWMRGPGPSPAPNHRSPSIGARSVDPEADWRAQRKAVPPPDLTDLRKKLAEASAKFKRGSIANPLEKLREATPTTQIWDQNAQNPPHSSADAEKGGDRR